MSSRASTGSPRTATTSSGETFSRGNVTDLAVDGHHSLADELVARAPRADTGAGEQDDQVHGLGRAHAALLSALACSRARISSTSSAPARTPRAAAGRRGSRVRTASGSLTGTVEAGAGRLDAVLLHQAALLGGTPIAYSDELPGPQRSRPGDGLEDRRPRPASRAGPASARSASRRRSTAHVLGAVLGHGERESTGDLRYSTPCWPAAVLGAAVHPRAAATLSSGSQAHASARRPAAMGRGAMKRSASRRSCKWQHAE